MTLLTISDLFSLNIFKEATLLNGLGEELLLCENGNMSFHWADFHETCDAIKTQLDSDPGLMEDFRKKEEGIKRLSAIPVWIRTRSKVLQTSVHRLYEQYLLNQKHLMGVDPFTPIEISFISATGPFKTMAVTECFNLTTYKEFVLVYLISGKLPKRDFRIRLRAKVLLEYGKDFQQAQLVHLEQLTTRGLLLSMEAPIFKEQMLNLSEMRLLIDTNILKNASGKDIPEMKAYLSQFAFNLLYSSRKEDAISFNFTDLNVQSSFDYLKNHKVYLFLPHSAIGLQNQTALHHIQGFIDYTKEMMRTYYKDKNQMRSA